MHDADRIRLQHMRDAAHDALQFIVDRDRCDLEGDRQLLLALTKSLEIIGEAARRVSDECRDTLPKVPWHEIIGMRNHLVHGYYAINKDALWNTVENRLPELLAQLDDALIGVCGHISS